MKLGDDDEAKAVDYLARVVLQSRPKIDPIGFIRFKPAPKQKPVAVPKKPGKKR